MHINVTCRGADTLPVDRILEFQGKIKQITNANLDRLKRSILKYGFTAPIFVWESGGDYFILDGHQRLKALIALRQEGYDLPLLPVDYIEAETETEAREKLLHITSQYGDFNIEELDLFLEEAAINPQALEMRLLGTELEYSKAAAGESGEEESSAEEEEPESAYREQYGVIVLCADEAEQEIVYNDLRSEGYECKVVAT